MSELAEKVSSRIAEHESTNVDKTKIMAIYKDESKNLKPAPVKSVETEKLREFSDRRQYARKKTDAKKRLVIYEFARIPPTVQVEIDEAIKKLWISSLPPTKWMLGGGKLPLLQICPTYVYHCMRVTTIGVDWPPESPDNQYHLNK